MARVPGDPSTSPTPSRWPTKSCPTVNGRSAAFRLPTSISSASTGDSDPVSTPRRALIQRSRHTTTGCSQDQPYRKRSPSKRALVSRARRALLQTAHRVDVNARIDMTDAIAWSNEDNRDRDPEMRFDDLSEPGGTGPLLPPIRRRRAAGRLAQVCRHPLSAARMARFSA